MTSRPPDHPQSPQSEPESERPSADLAPTSDPRNVDPGVPTAEMKVPDSLATTNVPEPDGPELRLDYAAISDVGRVRKENQDSGYAGPWLLAVCDGVGGAVRGDLASATAMSALRLLDRPPAELDGGEELTEVAGALHRAHVRIGELVEEDPDLNGTSTTATLGRFDGHRLALGHTGDSRAYLLREGELTQLTRDHTFVQTLVDEGKITAEEALVHPHRNVILQAIDGVRESEPDLFLLVLQEKDRLLFCSDGACDVLPPQRFAEILGDGPPAHAALELVREALEAGSTDNVTAVVADAVLATDPVEEGSITEPVLVGSAAELPQRPTGSGTRGRIRQLPTNKRQADDPDDDYVAPSVDFDPEEVRYAPRPPRRFIWLRILGAAAVVIGLVWGGLAVAWHFTQQQYYVSDDQGMVTIFRGLNTEILGFSLSEPYSTSNVPVESLADYDAKQVREGMAEGSLKDAKRAVEDLAARVETPPTDATATPSPTGTPSTAPTAVPTEAPTAQPSPAPGEATASTPATTLEPSTAPAAYDVLPDPALTPGLAAS